jgi:hypothetical protein
VEGGIRKMSCEGLIPINNVIGLTGIALIGWTNPTNMAPDDILERQDRLLDEILSQEPIKFPLPNDYTIECWPPGTRPEPDDIENLSAIWQQAFSEYPLDLSDHNVIKGLLRENHVSIIRHGGKVVAVALAESVEVLITAKDAAKIILRLAEISEVAVSKDHLGKNLSCILYQTLLKRFGSTTHCIFSECRANSKGILKAAHNAGMQPVGKLFGHIPISSVRGAIEQVRRYGDLVVFVSP